MSSENQYNNHLINESSIYLLQHSHNPVDWYPWGNEALERAKKEAKPILLSIGYAACHWCHVMERESFEDEETASLMNEYFINIKVDREERPDIDHIYMDAVQAMTGSGGWPLNVFLTPDLKPFYGGTYFPPVNVHNRLSWKEVLKRVHFTYLEKKDEIHEQADRLTNHLISSNIIGSIGNTENKDDIYSDKTLQTIADNMLLSADKVWGGFGKAPKFPQSYCILYLLRHYHYTKDEASLEQAVLSINKMIYGGIYDQVGGGFSRYSTDIKWMVPHFEKMLYDNALLLTVIAEAYQITQNELYAKTIRQTIDFIKREMLNDEGGFYSALDADSEGIEGKFYTWGKQEIDYILEEDADLFCKYFQVTEEGNWEETNILWCNNSISEFAEEHNVDIDIFSDIIESGINKLLIKREKRIRPHLDDKILLNWNALMITGLCKSYEALQDDSIKSLAIDCMRFIENKLIKSDNCLMHTYKNGVAKIEAFLDDYAYTIQACIALNNITGDFNYIVKAINLLQVANNKFKDSTTGFYYYTDENQQDIIVRKKELYDGATPSANAVMMNNIIYLSSYINSENQSIDYKLQVKNIISKIDNAITSYPTSFALWAINIQLINYDIKEIHLSGKEVENEINSMISWYIPEKLIIYRVNTNELNDSDFTNEKASKTSENKAVFRVCTKYTCSVYFVNLSDFYNYLTKA